VLSLINTGRDEFEHEMKQLRPVVIRLDKKRGELKMEVEHLRVRCCSFSVGVK
jgi:hypothetical protein